MSLAYSDHVILLRSSRSYESGRHKKASMQLRDANRGETGCQRGEGHGVRSTVLVAAVLSTLACACPRIPSFDQRTQVLCPGQEGEVPFRARGDLKMVVRVDDPRLAPPVGGRPDLRAPDTVTVTIVAGDEARKVSFLAVAASWPEPVAFYARPPEGGVIVASGSKDPSWWGEDRFEIGEVVAPEGRDIEIRHAGKAARVAGGSTSTAFQGTPLGGEWEFRSPLTDGERSGQDPPATSLRVQVMARCKAAR